MVTTFRIRSIPPFLPPGLPLSPLLLNLVTKAAARQPAHRSDRASCLILSILPSCQRLLGPGPFRHRRVDISAPPPVQPSPLDPVLPSVPSFHDPSSRFRVLLSPRRLRRHPRRHHPHRPRCRQRRHPRSRRHHCRLRLRHRHRPPPAPDFHPRLPRC